MGWLYRVTSLAALVSACGQVRSAPPDATAAADVGPVADVSPVVDAGPVADAVAVVDAVAMVDALAPPTVLTFAVGGTTTTMGPAGVTVTDACPTGQLLTGFTGATGLLSASSTITVVGQLIGQCGVAHIGSQTGTGFAITATAGIGLTTRGTVTTTPFTAALICPSNQFVVGIFGRAGTALDQLNIQCAPLSLIARGASWTGEVGAITPKGPDGAGGGSPATGACPDMQVATSAHTLVLSSGVIGALSLSCSVVAGT